MERLPERIQDLIEDWQRRRQKVIIPTPVLSEFLVIAHEQGPDYLDEIDTATHFQVKPFDQKAAIELSAMYLQERADMSQNAKKLDDKVDSKAKVKFDRQIVAILKANAKPGEEITIYSDDAGVAAFAARHGIQVVRTWELPAPLMRAVRLPGIEEEENDRDEQEQTKTVAANIRGSSGSDAENEARAATARVAASVEETTIAEPDEGESTKAVAEDG